MAAGSVMATPPCAEARSAGFRTSFLPGGLELMIAPPSRRFGFFTCRPRRQPVLIGPDKAKSHSPPGTGCLIGDGPHQSSAPNGLVRGARREWHSVGITWLGDPQQW